MTNEIEDKRKEILDNVDLFSKHQEQLCPECNKCIGCDFLDNAQTSLNSFDLGVEMARKEFLDKIDKFDFFESKAFDEQVYDGSGDINDWEEFFKLLREELKQSLGVKE